MANEWACLQIEKYTKREYSALLSGILFGNKQGISKDTKNAFIQTGTAHILAVSGLHVGMLYVIVSFIFPSSHYRRNSNG
ncbi:MAG: ComEC/Rec2 family competence protein [Saprospiraceae bacterium]|nr:ComEC/Rec2 family competence protein [Saprospiraceae bacterium]